MIRAIGILLLVCALPVGAQQQQVCPADPTKPGARAAWLCWVNAYKDVNGQKLPSTGPYSLTQTRIQRHKVGKNAKCNFDTIDQTVNVTPDILARKYTDLTDGKHCWRARHISRDEKGDEVYGAWSKTVSKVIPGGPTSNPSVQATTELVVY